MNRIFILLILCCMGSASKAQWIDSATRVEHERLKSRVDDFAFLMNKSIVYEKKYVNHLWGTFALVTASSIYGIARQSSINKNLTTSFYTPPPVFPLYLLIGSAFITGGIGLGHAKKARNYRWQAYMNLEKF